MTPTALTPRPRRFAIIAAALSAAMALLLPTTAVATEAPAAPAAEEALGYPAGSPAAALRSARLGAGWLAREINTNGGYVASFGAPDVTGTAYAVLGLHAAGVGRRASERAIGYLTTQLGEPLRTGGADDPGRIAQVVLAAVAAGRDPAAFGGTGALRNLPRRILATARTSGPDAGLFGAADPTFDGAFRQGLVLAALDAAGVGARTPKVAAGIAWLTRQQCEDALWTSYRADPTTPCPAADPATFAGPDTNSTSLAVQGLTAYGTLPRPTRTLTSLRGIQAADGGFPFLAAPGQNSDPNSTALSIQAILAAGGKPDSYTWTRGGSTPYEALVRFQLGCADPAADRGAFFFPGTRTPNTLATVQAVPALAGATLPLPPSIPAVGTPSFSCPAGTAPAAPAAPATAAAAPGACTGTTGVTVAVDFVAFGGGFATRCAPGAPATGVAALRQAGYTPAGTTRYGLAFICRINSKPTPAQDPCVSTPPASAYWAYYYALRGATTWTYSATAAISRRPPQGSIEAWAYGAGARPRKSPAQVRASVG